MSKPIPPSLQKLEEEERLKKLQTVGVIGHKIKKVKSFTPSPPPVRPLLEAVVTPSLEPVVVDPPIELELAPAVKTKSFIFTESPPPLRTVMTPSPQIVRRRIGDVVYDVYDTKFQNPLDRFFQRISRKKASVSRKKASVSRKKSKRGSVRAQRVKKSKSIPKRKR